MNSFDIFKSAPAPGQWAPTGPEFTFRPTATGQEVFGRIDTPDGWFLVGEPEPMLVCRVRDNTVVTLSAGEAWTAALAAQGGFSVAGQRAGMLEGMPLPVPEVPALPSPVGGRNGRANLPAKRRK